MRRSIAMSLLAGMATTSLAMETDYDEAYKRAEEEDKKILFIVEKPNSDFVERIQEETNLEDFCEEEAVCLRLDRKYRVANRDNKRLFDLPAFRPFDYIQGLALLEFNEDKSKLILKMMVSDTFAKLYIKDGMKKVLEILEKYTKRHRPTVGNTGAGGATGEGYQMQFLGLINAHRARYGRSQLVLDGNLNNYALRNNAQYTRTRNPHGVMAPNSGSGWAPGSNVVNAFNMWRASPPHNALMLRPGSRLGIACSYNSCTFYVQ